MHSTSYEHLKGLGLSIIFDNPIAAFFVIILWIIIAERKLGYNLQNDTHAAWLLLVGILTTLYILSSF